MPTTQTYSFITTITALTEGDAEAAREEAGGSIEDARESGFLPHGTDMIPGDLVEKDLKAVLTAYRELHDGLSNMIESGRISRDNLPDDYVWLLEKMVNLAGMDSGEVTDFEGERE